MVYDRQPASVQHVVHTGGTPDGTRQRCAVFAAGHGDAATTGPAGRLGLERPADVWRQTSVHHFAPAVRVHSSGATEVLHQRSSTVHGDAAAMSARVLERIRDTADHQVVATSSSRPLVRTGACPKTSAVLGLVPASAQRRQSLASLGEIMTGDRSARHRSPPAARSAAHRPNAQVWPISIPAGALSPTALGPPRSAHRHRRPGTVPTKPARGTMCRSRAWSAVVSVENPGSAGVQTHRPFKESIAPPRSRARIGVVAKTPTGVTSGSVSRVEHSFRHRG